MLICKQNRFRKSIRPTSIRLDEILVSNRICSVRGSFGSFSVGRDGLVSSAVLYHRNGRAMGRYTMAGGWEVWPTSREDYVEI